MAPTKASSKKEELCPLAKRIPKLTPLEGEDQEECKRRRRSFQSLVNTLYAYPSLIMATEAYVREKKENLEARADVGSDEHWDKVTTIMKLDINWVASYITEKLKLKAENVAKLMVSDAKAVYYILMYLINAVASFQIPDKCKVKQLLAFALDARINIVGSRHTVVASHIISETGSLQYALLVYALIFGDSNRAKTIVHRPTGDEASVPDSITITDGFEIQSNWSDSGAIATDGAAACYRLCQFFAPGVGPQRINVLKGKSKHFDGPLQVAQLKFDRLARERAEGQVVTHTIEAAVATPKRERATAAVEKARESLRKRQAEMDGRRRVSAKTASIMYPLGDVAKPAGSPNSVAAPMIGANEKEKAKLAVGEHAVDDASG